MGFATIYCQQCGGPEYMHLSTLDYRCKKCREKYPKTQEQLEKEYKEHCDKIKFNIKK